MAVDEYLRTSFEGAEPDYVEGELLERTVPNLFHSEIQVSLGDAFKPWQDRRELFRATEIRLRLGVDKFRVADFAVFSKRQFDSIPVDMPCAVVEIVSPDDRYDDLMVKLDDYEQAGVEFIFIARPATPTLFRYRSGDLLAQAALELPSHSVKIPLDAIFS